MLSRPILLLMLAAAAGCAGCLNPSVRLTRAECSPEYADGRLAALRFTADFEARNLQDEQLLYEVALLDSARRPIPTVTGRYCDAQGHLTAGKAIMVLRPYWEFPEETLTLPASELEANGLTDVTWAEFRIRAARTGTVLAQQQAPVREPSLAKAPPRAEPPRGAGSPRASGPGRQEAPARREGAVPGRPEERAVARAGPPRESVRPVGRSTGASTAPPTRAASQPVEGGAARSANRSGGAASASRGEPPRAERGAAPAGARPETRPPASQPDVNKPVRAPERASPASPAPPAASAPSSAPASTGAAAIGEEYYVVAVGDTLISIAREKLGDPWRWREIYALNREQLNWPDELRAGMRLRLPRR